MNFTLGSSWPMYQPLSLNRVALPLRTLIGSVQKAPASAATVLYLGLQPLQSSSFAAFGLTEPVAVSVLAVVVAAIVAEPAKPSWAITAMPRAGTRKRRHDRQRCGEPGGANPDIADRADDPGADLRMRMGNSSRSRVPAQAQPFQVARHALVPCLLNPRLWRGGSQPRCQKTTWSLISSLRLFDLYWGDWHTQSLPKRGPDKLAGKDW